MRQLAVPALLLSLVATVACATPAEEETGGDEGAITGGKSEDNSPLVLLLANAEATGASCVGTLLTDRIVVTEKDCAKKDLFVRRAAEDATTTARVKAVHIPTEANAEIALLELSTGLRGKTAKLAATDLGGGYHIVGAGTLTDGKGDASIVKGTIGSQTAENGLIVPENGKQICSNDVGAAVFKKIPSRVLGFLWKKGNWELSGLIVGQQETVRTAVPPVEPQPDSDPSNPDEEEDPKPQEEPAPAAASPSTSPTAKTCTGGAWRVAPLAKYATFLKKYAAEAFPQPKPEGSSSGGGFPFPFPFPGTGSGSSATATLKSCALVTTTIPATKTGERTIAIQAKASFANATKDKVVGQFGIAPKSATSTTNSMTWSPATALDSPSGTTFESRFEGGVNAPATEGEYLIAFRASANGGSTWTECDLDGSENGYSPAKALSLQVTPTAPATTQPAPAPTYPSTPSSDSTESSSSSDPSSSSEAEEEPLPKKKSKSDDDGGCSVAHGPAKTSSLPFAGLLLGLAAIARRRSNKRG